MASQGDFQLSKFEEMPYEMINEIFSYLTSKDIATNLAFVNKNLFNVCQNYLCGSVKIVQDDQEVTISAKDVHLKLRRLNIETFKRFSMIQRLDFQSCQERYNGGVLRSMFQNCSRLTHLSLNKVNCGDYPLEPPDTLSSLELVSVRNAQNLMLNCVNLRTFICVQDSKTMNESNDQIIYTLENNQRTLGTIELN